MTILSIYDEICYFIHINVYIASDWTLLFLIFVTEVREMSWLFFFSFLFFFNAPVTRKKQMSYGVVDLDENHVEEKRR